MNLKQQKQQWEQEGWERDIERFAKYKKMLEGFTSPTAIEHLKKQMQKIKDKYPLHLKNETI